MCSCSAFPLICPFRIYRGYSDSEKTVLLDLCCCGSQHKWLTEKWVMLFFLGAEAMTGVCLVMVISIEWGWSFLGRNAWPIFLPSTHSLDDLIQLHSFKYLQYSDDSWICIFSPGFSSKSKVTEPTAYSVFSTWIFNGQLTQSKFSSCPSFPRLPWLPNIPDVDIVVITRATHLTVVLTCFVVGLRIALSIGGVERGWR